MGSHLKASGRGLVVLTRRMLHRDSPEAVEGEGDGEVHGTSLRAAPPDKASQSMLNTDISLALAP